PQRHSQLGRTSAPREVGDMETKVHQHDDPTPTRWACEKQSSQATHGALTDRKIDQRTLPGSTAAVSVPKAERTPERTMSGKLGAGSVGRGRDMSFSAHRQRARDALLPAGIAPRGALGWSRGQAAEKGVDIGNHVQLDEKEPGCRKLSPA